MPLWIGTSLAAIALAGAAVPLADDAQLENGLNGLIASLESTSDRDSELAAAIQAAATLDAQQRPSGEVRITLAFTQLNHTGWRRLRAANHRALFTESIEWSVPLIERQGNDVWAEIFMGVRDGSVGTDKDSGASPWDAWYETDLFAGVALGRGPFELGLTYSAYISPTGNDAETVHELGVEVGLELDDHSWPTQVLGDPRVGLFSEVSHSNVRAFVEKVVYAELSFGPQYALLHNGLTLDLPVRLGFRLNDGEHLRAAPDKQFGFASVGTGFTLPVRWAGARPSALRIGGTWSLVGRATGDPDTGQRTGVFLFAAWTLEF